MSEPALTRRIKEVGTPQELFEIFGLHGGMFNEIHACASLNQLAKMENLFTQDVADSANLGDLLAFLEYQVSVMDPRTLQNTAWSVAQLSKKANIEIAPLMAALAERAKATMKLFEESDLSNLVWSLGQLHYNDTALMEAAARRVCKIRDSFKPEGINSVAWGFAELQVHDEMLMETLAQQAMKNISCFPLRTMAALASSFTRLNRSHAELSCTMTCALVDRSWKDQSTAAWFSRAQVLLASARAGAVDAACVDCVQEHWNQQALTAASEYSIAALLWACRELGCQGSHPQLFERLRDAAHQKRITWANIEDDSLLDPIKWNSVVLGKSSSK